MREQLYGQGSLYQRGPWWWIRYCVGGKEYRQSAKTTNQLKAERLLRQKIREKGARELGYMEAVPAPRRTPGVTVKQLLEDLETSYTVNGGRALPQFKSHVFPVTQLLGDLQAESLEEKDIERYILAREKTDKKKPATVNRELQLLGQALRVGCRRGKIGKMPFIPKLPELNVRRGFFDKQDFERVAFNLPEHLQDFAWFAFYTGWRKGEIAALTWDMVCFESKTITLPAEHSKNARGRTLIFAEEDDTGMTAIGEIMQRRWAKRLNVEHSFVFHYEGRQIGDIRRAWRTACKNAKVPGRLFHDLRRTAVRNMVRAGVPERVAQEVSGHKTRSVFERYNIVSFQDIKQAMKKVTKFFAPDPVSTSCANPEIKEDGKGKKKKSATPRNQ